MNCYIAFHKIHHHKQINLSNMAEIARECDSYTLRSDGQCLEGFHVFGVVGDNPFV